MSIAIVLTTIGSGAEAEKLARTLVEERLAACVNVLPPMTSVYRWKGEVERETEQQLVMKTAADGVSALETRLRELHPYDLPEFIVLTGRASEAYARWVTESASPSGT